ncbi:MAG TPA: nucleotidyltransferase domain-containing protein [Methanophagales archaeon]|nr:nucleotidyltransferase domain-containing protein [Methanophagales archaeon]
MNHEIQTLLKKVFGDLNYEKLILFGSRARGDFSEGSDYDILIIVQKRLGIKEKMRLSARLRRELAKKGIDADIILKSNDEIDYYKDKIGSVVRNALKEGVAL